VPIAITSYIIDNAGMKMTEKRRLADLAKSNWPEKKIIWELRETGMSFEAIRVKLGYRISRQAIQHKYKKYNELTPTEIEELYALRYL
jgi:lambda repressor-like predicted transcriptional regulator